MAGKKLELDHTGKTVADNISLIREARGFNYTELSKILEGLGRDIPPLGVRRIEDGQRRVDTDDLVAIAAALRVSPATLLMPGIASEGHQGRVSSTGLTEPISAGRVWEWLTAQYPPRDGVISFPEMYSFAEKAWPQWKFGPWVRKFDTDRADEAAHGDD